MGGFYVFYRLQVSVPNEINKYYQTELKNGFQTGAKLIQVPYFTAREDRLTLNVPEPTV